MGSLPTGHLGKLASQPQSDELRDQLFTSPVLYFCKEWKNILLFLISLWLPQPSLLSSKSCILFGSDCGAGFQVKNNWFYSCPHCHFLIHGKWGGVRGVTRISGWPPELTKKLKRTLNSWFSYLHFLSAGFTRCYYEVPAELGLVPRALCSGKWCQLSYIPACR